MQNSSGNKVSRRGEREEEERRRRRGEEVREASQEDLGSRRETIAMSRL